MSDLKILDADFMLAHKLTSKQHAMLNRLIATKDDREHDLWSEHDAIVDHENNTCVDYHDAMRVVAFIYRRFPLVRVIDRPESDAVEFRGLLLCEDARSYVWASIYLANDASKRSETCIADEMIDNLLHETA